MTKKLPPDERIRRRKARDKAYYLKHYDAVRERLRSHGQTWRKENPEKVRVIQRRGRRKLRKTVIEEYGGRCVCCGIDDFPFLSIDHVANDGAAHRREANLHAGRIYGWLKKNNYPDGFQVLCYNCNLAKAHHGGECPHQTRIKEAQALEAGP